MMTIKLRQISGYKVRWRFFPIVLCLFFSLPQFIQAQCSSISGRVFTDFDEDGSFDGLPSETGIPNVKVYAYDDSNTAVDSSLTASDGTYTLAALPATANYRIEFVSLPDGYFPYAADATTAATTKGSTTVIVGASGCTADLGAYLKYDYCQDNPRLYTNCYVNGYYSTNGTLPVIVSWDYNESNSASPTTVIEEATNIQMAATNGIAYHRSNNSLLAAAFLKRHASFGVGGTGAIYRKDLTAGTTSTWFDFNSVIGANTAGVDPHPNSTDFDCDAATFPLVGKGSLGDIDISYDEDTLYAINLADRKLYKIDITDFPATPVIGDIHSVDIPVLTTSSGNHVEGISDPDPANNMRPFALKYHNDKVYIGVTYTGESNGSGGVGSTDDLYAYVYEYSPSDNSFTIVFSYALDYPRGCAVFGCDNTTPAGDGDAEWAPWTNTWQFRNTNFGIGGANEIIYPQPWLTDIEFTVDGQMMLALRDRWGDQTGFDQYDPTCTGTLWKGDVAGDLLMACASGGTWTIENNAACGPYGPTNGANTGYGPGNGEFFWGDGVLEVGDPYGPGVETHEETMLGGIVVVPGKGEIVGTAYDPLSYYEGGAIWFDYSTGTRTSDIVLYETRNETSPYSFAKGGALGDMEAGCSVAPIEIGNIVWFDEDADGVQDPDEVPLTNVTVNLYDGGGALIGSATTDANGRYYFGGENDINLSGANSLTPITNYQLRILLSDAQSNDGSVTELLAATPEGGSGNSQASNDNHDSDGILVMDVSGDYVSHSFTTGDNGENNHNYDFGFKTCPSLAIAASNSPTQCGGNDGEIMLTINYVADGTYTINYEDGLANPQSWTNVVLTNNSATISGLVEGTYNNLSITYNGCSSSEDVDVILSDPTIPTLAAVGTDPSLCHYTDGDILITLTDVIDGTYTIYYEDENAVLQSFTNVVVSGGQASISNLGAGTFNNLYITDNACTSIENVDIVLTEVCNYDYGDLPDISSDSTTNDYQTLIANGGPEHLIFPGIYLGASVDFELDGQASSNALGDGDDEDGILFPNSLLIVPGGIVNLPLSATNTTGNTAYLEMWIDWNGDGDFSDEGEMVADIDDGSSVFPNSLPINIPNDVLQNQNLGVRIRLSNEDDMTPYGLVNSGEVEDYLIQIDCDQQACLSISINIDRNE